MSFASSNLVYNPDKTMYNSITTSQLEQFEEAWILYILEEKRYGQAFCDHFTIGNATPLYHFRDDRISKRWIIDNYIEK